MLKTNLIATLGLCSAAILPACEGQAPKQQCPNIIYIMSDDHAYQAISAYVGFARARPILQS